MLKLSQFEVNEQQNVCQAVTKHKIWYIIEINPDDVVAFLYA